MPQRQFVPELQPMYDFGYYFYRPNVSARDRDLAVALKFGNDSAYLDAATEGFYDAMEDAESHD